MSATRQVLCCDAVSWLSTFEKARDAALVASLPDISEFPQYSLEEWQEWFVSTVGLILGKTSEDNVSIFYQSDIKYKGIWIDKGYLCQKAAEKTGDKLLWHKIACRVVPGRSTYARPSYSHILCFSKSLRLEARDATPDVMPDIGEKVWARGMGIQACAFICTFLASKTETKMVINPFCGHGSIIAMANAHGVSAIGIERSEKRANIARRLQVFSPEDAPINWQWHCDN